MADIFNMLDTWNAGATVFTGIKLSVTDTASAAGSLLMDLQVGGSSKFNVTKDGMISVREGSYSNMSLRFGYSSTNGIYGTSSTISFQLGSSVPVQITSTNGLSSEIALCLSAGGSSPDIFLRRDAANTLAQRNGVNAQAFNLYNTYTDASNYERGFMKFASNFLQIGTEKLGTGATRGMELSTPYGGPLVQQANNVWEFCNTNRTFPSIRMACGSGAFVGASMQIGFNAADFFTSGTVDAGFKRSAAAIIGVTNGSTGGGSLEMQEVTAPAAPATNNVRIYAEDNGSGKTRLMARFATGSAVQIAIEP